MARGFLDAAALLAAFFGLAATGAVASASDMMNTTTTDLATRANRMAHGRTTTLTTPRCLNGRADGEGLHPRVSPRPAVDVLAAPFQPTFHLKGRRAMPRAAYRRIAESAGYLTVGLAGTRLHVRWALLRAENRRPLQNTELHRVFRRFTPFLGLSARWQPCRGVATTFPNTHVDLQLGAPLGRRYDDVQMRPCIKQTSSPPVDSPHSDPHDSLRSFNPRGEHYTTTTVMHRCTNVDTPRRTPCLVNTPRAKSLALLEHAHTPRTRPGNTIAAVTWIPASISEVTV